MTLREAKSYVIQLLGEEKADLWWSLKNPNLGNLSPNFMVQCGREEKLLQWISYTKTENDEFDKYVASGKFNVGSDPVN